MHSNRPGNGAVRPIGDAARLPGERSVRQVPGATRDDRAACPHSGAVRLLPETFATPRIDAAVRRVVLSAALVFLTAAWTPPVRAADEAPRALPLEQITFTDGTKSPRTIAARVLIEAVDGGLLAEGQDGRLWTIEKPQLSTRAPTGQAFAPAPAEALGRQLQQELGSGFEVVTTRHYVICTSAGKPYAVWCGTLFERLFAAFQNYWKQRGIALHEPEFPLIALVFADPRQFATFASKDAGPEVADAKGYYSIGTNRIVLYDLTAINGRPADSTGEINRRLQAAPFNIATVVHEATHQIAFNSGLHTRYADNPLWLTEGMAMFFETPDLTSKSGWKTVGAVNPLRLKQFQEYSARRRPADSLRTLIASDARFTDAEQMGDAYAEAWSLSYFLIRTKKDAYTAYLSQVAAKPRLTWNSPAEREAEFKAAFGEDLSQLEADWLRYMRRPGK